MRVDLIESSNKSIDQVDPSEYAFVKNFSPDKGHTVMYFVDNTETCTIFNAWYEMNILKHTSELVEADVKYGKIYDLKDHKVKYEIIQKNPLSRTLRLIDRETKKAINAVEDLSSHSSKNELMLLLEFANGRSK